MPLQGAALNRGAFFCIRRTVFGAWPEAQPNFLLWSERQVRLQGALARSYCDTYSNLFFSSPAIHQTLHTFATGYYPDIKLICSTLVISIIQFFNQSGIFKCITANVIG